MSDVEVGATLASRTPSGRDCLQWRSRGQMQMHAADREVVRIPIIDGDPIRQGGQWQNRLNRHGLYFWQTTDASTRVSSPRKIALLDLIPLWNLFWFFKAYAGGARAGVATLELLDDNRARLIAPIRLARVVGVLTIVATLCYAAHLIFWALAIPGLTARAFALLFSLGEATNFYIGYMNSHYIWAYVARVAPLAILVVQLCLRYKLLAALQGIGEYAQSARNTEPHATEAEIAAEREEARRLFADAARKNAEKKF